MKNKTDLLNNPLEMEDRIKRKRLCKRLRMDIENFAFIKHKIFQANIIIIMNQSSRLSLIEDLKNR
jgi:hypothetical protein